MKIQIQEVKDNRTQEAKAFEAGWIAQFHLLKPYLPEIIDDELDTDYFDYQYDSMMIAFDRYQKENEIQEQEKGKIQIESGSDGSGIAVSK